MRGWSHLAWHRLLTRFTIYITYYRLPPPHWLQWPYCFASISLDRGSVDDDDDNEVSLYSIVALVMESTATIILPDHHKMPSGRRDNSTTTTTTTTAITTLIVNPPIDRRRPFQRGNEAEDLRWPATAAAQRKQFVLYTLIPGLPFWTMTTIT